MGMEKIVSDQDIWFGNDSKDEYKGNIEITSIDYED